MPSHRSSASALRRGEIVTVTLSSMAPGGEAISKDKGIALFVDRGAPGDIVDVELYDVRKDFAKGRVVAVRQPSSQRAEPPCKLFKVCGGCQWQHLSYVAQLENKTSIVKQAVKHIGRLDPAIVKSCIGAEQALFYRNKVQFPVRNPQGSSRILAGYYKPDSHELVNIKHCPVQSQQLDRMLEVVKEVLEKYQVKAYDEKSGKGLLRHITARESRASGEILVTLVINKSSEKVPEFLFRAAEEIRAGDDKIVGVCVNFNSRPGNKILGDVTLPLSGQPYIEEVLTAKNEKMPERLKRGIKFRLSASSFFQVNTEQAVRLLEEVHQAVYSRSLAQDEADGCLKAQQTAERAPVIFDAYAGVGAIALFLAPGAAKVYAIEEHPAAVTDGRHNAELNDMTNVDFRQGLVENELPRLIEEGVRPDIVVLDPPRKGLSREVVNTVLRLSPQKIVYVSCNPATLARDLRLLEIGMRDDDDNMAPYEESQEDVGFAEEKKQSLGYKTIQIQPLDLFPQTYHVESVAILEKV
ncbi:MAG TPA: 23S rRNA (uracil(1939)-C(5))-methyltransferase RlmD [Candidatus Obscuribacterales bacterium]